MTGSPGGRRPDAGVTMIEMMIALALFALIGGAGFAMLDQVLRSQRGTEGRLERLSARQRALHVIGADFAMAEPHSLTATDAGVSLKRSRAGGSLRLHYRLTGGTLHRGLSGSDGEGLADQAILTGIDSATWRFLTPEGRWSAQWPVEAGQSLATPANPRAVELVLALHGRELALRRVVRLPADLD